MKKLIIIILLAIFIQTEFLHAQWQGSGTLQDPYKIFTLADLDSIRTNYTNFNYYQNINFELQNDINDSVTEAVLGDFYGYFHGKGHTIYLNIFDINENYFIRNLNGYVDSITFKGRYIANSSLFCCITETGILSDITLDLDIIPSHGFSSNPPLVEDYVQILNEDNFGIIKNCINNSDINVTVTTDTSSVTSVEIINRFNAGKILNCINNGNINITTNSSNNIFVYIFSEENSISIEMPDGGIINCINNGNINIIGVAAYCEISPFSQNNHARIVNCINNGNITAKRTDVCGIFAAMYSSDNLISNCLNTGSLIGEKTAGGIVGELICILPNYNDSVPSGIINCMNIGQITGGTETGGIIGRINFQYANCAVIKNNLNLNKTTGYSILGDSTSAFSQITEFTNNYYDKQMQRQTATVMGDISGVAEGKLTSELTGSSPELQAMLGDGWSYAEGRYPIPLGLENDSMALVAATPVYLDFEDENNYNHVDSVTKNFTVGLENNVTWEETNGRVSFNNENATLLNIGTEILKVSLGNYSKDLRIHILDTEPIDIQENITEKGIAIYPNPANDYISINLNGINADKMELCDITGKIILSQSFSGDNSAIYIGSIKHGMYFLNIYIENQQLVTTKFVKE